MPLTIKRTNITSIAANSVLFNGSSQYLTATRTGGWLKSANNFTMECWVYFTRHPSSYGGFNASCVAGTSDSSNGWELNFGGNVSATTSLNFSIKNITGISATRAFNTNTWYHIAVVRSGTTITLYIDGTSAGTATVSSWTDTAQLRVGALNLRPYFYYFPGYISNFRIVDGTAVYTSNFTPPTATLTAIANTSLLTCNAPTIVDSSSNNFTITNNGSATVSSINPFRAPINNFQFVNRNNNATVLPGTQKAIFGYGSGGGLQSLTNLVSNTGVVATDTTGVGTGRSQLAAAGYGSDKAIFGYGRASSNNYSMTNLVSNVGVVSTDTTGVGTARSNLAAAGYGSDKAIFGYGDSGNFSYVSTTNLVGNTGVVANDTTGVGTARFRLAAAGYGSDKAIFGYGISSNNWSITNLVSNTGVVATNTTGVGTSRSSLAAAGYGTDKAIFGYGETHINVSITNLVSNTGVVVTDTTGVGTSRYALAAASYGSDKAIFGYGYADAFASMTNLVSNTGVVATDTTGVGTARFYPAAAGYSVTTIPAPSRMSLKKVYADPAATLVTNGLVLNLDASNASSYPGSGTTWTDLSGNSNTGTLTNGPTFNSANGGSIVFDGSNDYVQVINGYTNTLKNNNNWSVSFWFKANSLSNDPVLLGPEVGQLNYYDLFLEVGINSIYFAAGGGSGVNYLTNSSSVSLAINTIYNIVYIKTGITTGKVFLNGIEVPLSASGTGLGSMPNSNADFRIGTFKAGSFFLNGNIYQTLIYNKSLSAPEVLQNYNVTKTKFGL